MLASSIKRKWRGASGPTETDKLAAKESGVDIESYIGVDGGVPLEVAVVVAGLSFADRGIADIETRVHRVVALAADGRSGFDMSHQNGALNWLKLKWPTLSDAQTTAATEMIYARMRAFMRAGTAHAKVRNWMTDY